MLLINFSHPLTPVQRASIESLSGQSIEHIIEAKTQFDPDQPFADQARQVVDTVGLSSEQWQTAPLLINLPSLSVIAALVLAELHGRCGYFPAVLRLKPIPQAIPPQFEVAEILNVQMMRDTARQRR
jgi:hypothetical protein